MSFKVMGVLYACIYILVDPEAGCSIIDASRQKTGKCLFNENEAVYDSKHGVCLVLLTVYNAWLI